MILEPPQVVAVLGMIIAAIVDARTGKIPNALNGVLLLAGLGWWTVDGHWMVGLMGAVLGFATHYPLWLLGVERGGDAKLFIALGGLLGMWGMWNATAWTGVLYFPVGFAILALRGRLGNFVASIRYVVDRARGVSEDQLEAPEPTVLRTGPIIAIAGIASLFWYILPGGV